MVMVTALLLRDAIASSDFPTHNAFQEDHGGIDAFVAGSSAVEYLHVPLHLLPLYQAGPPSAPGPRMSPSSICAGGRWIVHFPDQIAATA
ncbi:MAG: hypothetical protein JRJ12_11580 [Deltaproteobacteria bacterium]|nr:hypothetical protein [Deltaproteobacteria bacterium]MBW2070382.1 hypothetical protein [Deltaproteobacteria bacterium]